MDVNKVKFVDAPPTIERSRDSKYRPIYEIYNTMVIDKVKTWASIPLENIEEGNRLRVRLTTYAKNVGKPIRTAVRLVDDTYNFYFQLK